MNDITLELKECLEYCKQQNGRDSCKNCGLDYDMLDHIHYLVGEEVKKERARIVKIIEQFKDRNDGEILKDIGFNVMEYPAPAARKVCWKLLDLIK